MSLAQEIAKRRWRSIRLAGGGGDVAHIDRKARRESVIIGQRRDIASPQSAPGFQRGGGQMHIMKGGVQIVRECRRVFAYHELQREGGQRGVFRRRKIAMPRQRAALHERLTLGA